MENDPHVENRNHAEEPAERNPRIIVALMVAGIVIVLAVMLLISALVGVEQPN